ncbi:MAG TPA: class I SAM-dependent methyltransferase [Tepidisphaeraceae bacterium]|nr:class I SAM-dependent methyltransferase [Tepidisphaeraceae bacterium]
MPAIHITVVLTCAVLVLLIVKAFLAPRLLRAWLGVKRNDGGPTVWQDRVELRYQDLDTGLWMFARYKLRLDAMFRELPGFVKDIPTIRTALDLGCGRGVAGCSLLEWYPELTLYGIEPNPKWVRAAAAAFGERGRVFQAGAPDFEVPALPDRLDAVFALDMIHFLNDSELDLTLRRIRTRLDEGAHFILRAPMAPEGSGSLLWDLDKITRKLNGTYACFRTPEGISQAITRAGFRIIHIQMSGANRELCWFIATASSENGKPLDPAHSTEEPAQENHAGHHEPDADVNPNQGAQVPAAEFIPSL